MYRKGRDDVNCSYLHQRDSQNLGDSNSRNIHHFAVLLLSLTLRRARGQVAPLDEYLKIFKIGASKAHQLLFQLLKYPLTLFTTNPSPTVATGGHRLVICRLQSAS